MKKTRSKCKSLPVEILHKIFQLGKAQDLCNYALVCKAWTIPVQSALYSTVIIKTLPQLEQFYETVKQNPQLGYKVKTFYLDIPLTFLDKETRKDIVHNSYHILQELLCTWLPNLEVLRDHTVKSYRPIRCALKESQLKRLKTISSPPNDLEGGEVEIYTTCVLLLKDRITSVRIRDRYESGEETSGNRLNAERLYEQLSQFKNIKQLEISKETEEEISVLEHVLETCKTLKSLSFKFHSQSAPNNSISINTIASVDPAYNINSLVADVNVVRDNKLLLYVMRKFPKLSTFFLTMNESSPTCLNLQILSQLLKYSTKINSFLATDLRLDDHNISETIGEYWKKAAAPGSQRVDFIYTEEMPQNEGYKLEIIRNSMNAITTLTYPASEYGLHYNNFMEKCGNFLQEFRYESSTEDLTENTKVPEDLLPNVFKYCTNLQNVRITQSTLTRGSHSSIDFCNKLSLNEVFFDHCVLYAEALEQLSLMLPRTKVLKLGKMIDHSASSDIESVPGGDPDIEIIMPYTNIDRVVFEEFHYLEKPVYFKVFAVDSQSYSYYRYHRDYRNSNEQNYTNSTDCIRAYICCKSKPKIDVIILYT